MWKQAEQEKLEEKKDGRQYDITVTGTDMGKVTENLISKIGMGNSAMSAAPTVTGGSDRQRGCNNKNNGGHLEMSISGVGQNYYQNNVTSVKNKKNMSDTEETGGMRELTEAEEMAAFKKEFYAELERIPKNRTITNLAVNISEEAFKNMKDDPEYRAKIMSALQRDLTSSFAPLKASLLITVGATEKDYRGDSWSGPNNDSEFFARSQDSFYLKTSGQKDGNKELLEEYLEKQAKAKKQQQEMLNEKIAKQEQERSRLAKAWNSERQMARASSIYEANVMTEIVADGDSLFG